MLKIKGLSISVTGKAIVQGVNLEIKKGEVVILFGPNGSGKTTLIKAIMGFSGYAINQGEIIFKDKLINHLKIEERVKMGLGLLYQHPPKIRGIRLAQLADFLCKDKKKMSDLAERLSLTGHLHREINLGFSGGEIKRSELFQVMLQDPDLLFLDEPESGVDIENIGIMGKVIDDYLSKEGKSALIITHTGYILDYVKAKRGCVMMDGKFFCVGGPKEMFESIRSSGYEKCKECECPKTN